MPSLGSGLSLGTLNTIPGYDFDASAYFTTTGVTDPIARYQINEFVRGIKNLGLWNNMACWPLRSTQNKGSGTIVYSLGGLGTYNGTLNGTSLPSWGKSGLTNSSDGYVRTAFPWSTTHSGLAVYNQSSTSGLQTIMQFGDGLAGASNGRRSNMRVDASLNLFNGSFTSYAFGPSSLNAFKMAGYGLVSASSLLGYNDGATSTVSASPISVAGGTATNNFTFLSQGGPAGDSSGQYFAGSSAFAVAFNIQLSSGQFSSIYSLYNSTLGANLNDPDSEAYFTRANITDPTAKTQINNFVIGVKNLGLWGDMVCWPLRSTQNAGTGSIAYSLGGFGTYNGTLVNSPIWSSDGITFTSGSSQKINVPNITISKTDLIFATCQATTSGNLRSIEAGWGADGSGIWSGFNGTYYWDVRSTAGTLNRQNGGTASTSRVFTHGIASTSGSSFFVNGTSLLSNAVSSTNASLSAFQINQNGGSGNISFAMFSQSTTGHASLYNLYKTTLGTGLGLP